MVETLKWMGLVAIVLAAVAISAYLLLRMWKRQHGAVLPERRESYASLSSLRDWSGQRWRELLAAMDDRRRWRAWGQRPPASPVEIYHALLLMAQRRECSRPLSATPLEFSPALKDCFPGNEDSVDRFSIAFVQAYYGEKTPSRQELQELGQAWRAFRRRLDLEKKAGSAP